jgi:hypothetical protein
MRTTGVIFFVMIVLFLKRVIEMVMIMTMFVMLMAVSMATGFFN